MDDSLAIIIPAYKGKYLNCTLDSIFSMNKIELANVYVFDDNSPDNLKKICKPYFSNSNFKYRKYKDNLGSKNLTAQWNRCVRDTNEKWIWLFSDDDVVTQNCLKDFLNCLRKNDDKFSIYRYNTKIISKSGSIIKSNPVHPKIETSTSYVEAKLNFERIGFVTEFIFHRNIFNKVKGYIPFPKAWNSDDATILQFGKFSKIYTIRDSFVYWRLSDINISSVLDSDVHKLYDALKKYINWLMDTGFFERKSNEFLLSRYYIQQYIYIYGFSLKTCKKLIIDWKEFWNKNVISFILNFLIFVLAKLKSKI